MFSYIQTKFNQPQSTAGLSISDGVKAISDRFETGDPIVEIYGENFLGISANAAAWAEDQTDPLVRLRLEKEDSDPGRFWTLLVMGLRKYRPEIGLTVLNTILDHHTNPPAPAREKLTRELSEISFIFVLEGIEHISQQDWWPDFVSWLQKSAVGKHTLLLNYSAEPILKQFAIHLQPNQINNTVSQSVEAVEWLARLSSELKTTLAAMDIWWQPWLSSQFEGQPIASGFEALQAAGLIDEVYPGAWLPTCMLVKLLDSQEKAENGLRLKEQKRNLAERLTEQGEWLEGIRHTLKTGDFEEAAEMFEKESERFLQDPKDAADVLFWLKELPGILLTSRPVLCWLTAACAAEIGLLLQVKTYLDEAENNLMSLLRFSRSQEQWRNMVINEQGVSVADLLERIEHLRSG